MNYYFINVAENLAQKNTQAKLQIPRLFKGDQRDKYKLGEISRSDMKKLSQRKHTKIFNIYEDFETQILVFCPQTLRIPCEFQ